MKNLRRAIVVADLPNAGMCNLFFSWAKALIFAKEHNLPLFVFGWSRPHIGPWIRNEKNKRFYGLYFANYQSEIARIIIRIRMLTSSKQNVLNPIETKGKEFRGLYVFREVPNPRLGPLYEPLHAHRHVIKQELLNLTRPKYLRTLEKLEKPEIAIHVRRGDFANHPLFVEDDYFIECVNAIQQKHERPLKVTVFSDGYPEELADLLKKVNGHLADEQDDIVDLLLMSQAKVLITSLGSTFSYWAGFLSEGSIILHPKHNCGQLRPEGFEGTINQYMLV